MKSVIYVELSNLQCTIDRYT